MRHIGIRTFILLFFLINPLRGGDTLRYPYGGAEEYSKESRSIRLIFHNPVSFDYRVFRRVLFTEAIFDSEASFIATNFSQFASFDHATFKKQANFNMSSFEDAQFQTRFENNVSFRFALFRKILFSGDHRLTFGINQVPSNQQHKFNRDVDFYGSKFEGETQFQDMEFMGHVDFSYCQFLGTTNFLGVKWNADSVSFLRCYFADIVQLGDPNYPTNVQKFDFTQTEFADAGEITIGGVSIEYPGAQIVLLSPVDLKLQLEKFKYIRIDTALDFYSKKNIITKLKETSFTGEEFKRERFELDYIFLKSTINQKETTAREYYPWWHPLVLGRQFYEITMGLGYRPFRLVWWAVGVIFLFSLLFFFTMPLEINRYILNKRMLSPHKKRFPYAHRRIAFDTFLNCAYFSTMLFVNIKLRQDLLFSFRSQQKKIIVAEWAIGVLIYVAFLTLSEAGSILQTLKTLFFG